MRKRCKMLVIVLALLLASVTMAQDAGNPTIAILRFGPLPNMEITEGAILDMLQSYGFISADENRMLEERSVLALAGDHINILWGDAGFSLPNANLLVRNAVDEDVDVIMTLGAQITLAAVSITQDMDPPIPVLFSAVPSPNQYGIGAAPCIKPEHVTGAGSALDYAYVLSALRLQDPDIASVGALYGTGEPGGAYGVEQLTALGEEQGIAVEVVGVAALTDLRAAANRLVESDIEAIILPMNDITTSGLPIITTVANEAGIPVFHPSFSAIYYGATIGAGASPFYEQGINVGRILVAHLNGELDIARTAISASGQRGIGVNLDSADAQGVEISDEVMTEAIAVIDGGRPSKLNPGILAAIARRGVIVPMEERIEEDRAWLESLHCTDELIAEQQADLDAAE